MKTEYNRLHQPPLLYNFIEEIVFLNGSRKLTNRLISFFSLFFIKIKGHYIKFIKNEWTQISLILTGHMVLGSLVLFIAYKLVLII